MRRYLLIILFFASVPVSVSAYKSNLDTPPNAAEIKGPKVGLVLSGGGAKGIMHIALLRAMEEVNMPIDYIGGTSMGAIVGGLYSIGYSADELEEIVQSADWDRLLSDDVSRRYIPIEEKQWDSIYMISLPIINRRISLPTGLIAGQEISKLFTRLTLPVHGITDFNQFPIPFVAIATNLENGEPIVMRSGYLPDVLRSSMAIPSVFAPHEIYGKRTIDGGVARNFPVTDVLEMGAEYVIGINVSDTDQRADTLSNIISILDRTVNYQIVETTLDQARLVDHLIEPNIGDFSMVSFDAIPEIIRISKEAVEAFKPRLKVIADSLNQLRSGTEARPTYSAVDSIYVTDIKIHDQKLTQERVVLSELGVEPYSTVTPAQIENGIDKVYSLQFFHTVTYRLEPVDNGYTLHVSVKEKLDDQFKVGLRYDNREKSSLIFNATFRNTYKPSSTLRLNIRLGEETAYDGQFFYYLGFKPKLGVNLRANFSNIRDDFYGADGVLSATAETESLFGEFWVGPVVSSTLIMGVGLKEEVFRLRRFVGDVGNFKEWRNNHSLLAFLWIDTTNDGVFPTNGQMLRADFTQTMPWFGQPLDFTEYSARWENYIPMGSNVTGHLHFQSFITRGEAPVHLRKYLGGIDNFPGYYENEIQGEWLKSAQIGAQIQIFHNRFLIPSIAIGQVSAVGEFDPKLNPLIYSWSLVGAAKTVVGPVKIGISGSERHNLLYDIRVGFEF
jgi:NTE family protein